MNAASPLDPMALLFERDRPALERMIDDVSWLCHHGSYPSACKVFGELRRLIDHHLIAEERCVVALEREGHCPPALALRVQVSHDHLLALVENAWRTISGSDGDDYDKPLEALRRGILGHARSDRRLLFPALSARYTDPSELDRAVHSIVDP